MLIIRTDTNSRSTRTVESLRKGYAQWAEIGIPGKPAEEGQTSHGGKGGHHRIRTCRLDRGNLRGSGESPAPGLRRSHHAGERHARHAAAGPACPDHGGGKL